MFTKTTILFLCAVSIGLIVAHEESESEETNICNTESITSHLKEEVDCPRKLKCKTEVVEVGINSHKTIEICHFGDSLPNKSCLTERMLEPLVAGMMRSTNECDPFADEKPKEDDSSADKDNKAGSCKEGFTCCKTDKGHHCFRPSKESNTLRDDSEDKKLKNSVEQNSDEKP